MDSHLEITSIIVYLAMLIGMSLLFGRLNKNVSDYFRSGCKGTWWLVGSSLLMSGISAYTFSGNAGAAFDAGFSPLGIYAGNTLALLILAAFLAGWYRQLRAITDADAVRMRFGPATEQLTVYIMVPMGFFHSAFTLYGLSIFSSAVLGLPVGGVIIGLGIVVLLYSTFGGSWAVMATDFVQGLILISVTLLVAFLCLEKMGGVGPFLQAATSEPDFKLIKAAGVFEAGRFTGLWLFTTLLLQCMGQTNLRFSNRFFAAKDGREARKAALLAAILMAVGSFVWFIPPMVARLTMADAVHALALNNPAEASYALMAKEVLPNGMLGLMIIAMFAATMSTLDTGLNRNAAVVVQNVMPPLYRKRGWTMPGQARLVRVGQVATFVFGLMIVFLALHFSRQEGFSMFHALLDINVIFAVPITVPMLLGVFIRRVPSYAALVSWGCGAAPSLVAFVSDTIFDDPWTFQVRGLLAVGCGVVGFFATMPFYGRSPAAFRKQVETFFETMHRPVDFAREVGESNDSLQSIVLGAASLLVGLAILPLLLVPNPVGGRLGVLFIALFCSTVGGFMLIAGMRAKRRKDNL